MNAYLAVVGQCSFFNFLAYNAWCNILTFIYDKNIILHAFHIIHYPHLCTIHHLSLISFVENDFIATSRNTTKLKVGFSFSPHYIIIWYQRSRRWRCFKHKQWYVYVLEFAGICRIHFYFTTRYLKIRFIIQSKASHRKTECIVYIYTIFMLLLLTIL